MTSIVQLDASDTAQFAERTVERDPAFWAALAFAGLMHAAVLVAVVYKVDGSRRVLGEENASEEAISVSFITEAELRSQSTVPQSAAAPPPAPPQQQPTPAAQPASPQEALKPTVDEQQPPVETPPEKAPEKPPEKSPEKPVDQIAEKPFETTVEAPPEKPPETPSEKSVPDLFKLDAPGEAKPKAEPAKPAKAAPPKPAQPAAKPPAQQRTAKLDLSPPPSNSKAPSFGAGRAAGLQRPPGITRAGWNDDFARAVIRALQSTMPQLRDTRGRVTVRILLNENGNVRSVEVVKSADNATLDQSVVFAARQTSYPLPPLVANEADRTFLVTYIYQ